MPKASLFAPLARPPVRRYSTSGRLQLSPKIVLHTGIQLGSTGKWCCRWRRPASPIIETPDPLYSAICSTQVPRVSPEEDGALILGLKTLREQLDIDVMESENGLVPTMPAAGSTMPVGWRRESASEGAMQEVASAKEDLNGVDDSFMEELLAQIPAMVIER